MDFLFGALQKNLYICALITQENEIMASIDDKYYWLIQALSHGAKKTLKELQDEFLNSEVSYCVYDGSKKGLTRSTFARWKDALPSSHYHVTILCNNRHEYYIDPTNDSQGRVVREGMQSMAHTIHDLLQYPKLHDRIMMEETPSENDYLRTLLQAMENNSPVNLTYQKFTDSTPSTYKVYPYFLRCFRRRWYVIVYNTSPIKAAVRTYALDRVKGVKIIPDETFEFPPSSEMESVEAYYKGYYGVFREESVDEERIVIKAKGRERDYLRTLPLHPTQTESFLDANNQEYSRFTFHLRPTDELVTSILRMGTNVEVLEPASLREQVRQMAQAVAQMYSPSK